MAEAPNAAKKTSMNKLDLGDWETSFNGYYVMENVEIQSPIVRLFFARNFIQTQRELYYLTVLARFALRVEAHAAELYRAIDTNIQKNTVKLEDMSIQLGASMASTNVKPIHGSTQSIKGEVPVSSPQARLILELFQKADTYHSNLMAAWIAGEIQTRDRELAEERMKKLVRNVINFIRTSHGQTTSKARKNVDEMPEDVRSELVASEQLANSEAAKLEEEENIPPKRTESATSVASAEPAVAA